MKFLRNYRWSSLREGRLGRYLPYALGEIVLVVAGILIALQINNRNDIRKLRKVERELMVDLVENLEINIGQLHEDLVWDSLAISSGHAILDMLEEEGGYPDTLGDYFQESRLVPNPYLTTSAYKAIENRGFEIISNKSLRKDIIRLFDDVYPSMILELQTIDERVMKPHMQRYMLEHFEYGTHLQPNDFEVLKTDQYYRNILSFNVFILRYFVAKRKSCLAEVQRVKQEVELWLDTTGDRG